jgi:hypothetical protein
MKRSYLILLMVLPLLLLSCISEKKKGEFNILEEEGIQIAINPDHPVLTKGSYKDIIFTEELTIGSREGDPHFTFGELISFTVDGDGNMYVLDWRGKIVRKFDVKGKYQLSIGREGQGPGEFAFPDEIRFLANGQIVIFEGESQKFSCFTQEGKFVKSGRFLELMYSPYFGLSNGNFIATNIQRDSEKTVTITGLFNEKSELLVPFHRREKQPDLPWPSQDDVNARAKRLAEVCSRAAFRNTTVIALNKKEDIYFAFTDKYEIKIYSSEAKLKKVIRTELPLLPVEKKDRQDFLNILLPREISTWESLGKQFQNKIKSLIRFPKKKPAFLSIIPMDNDYLMIIRDRWFNQNSLVNIFDPQGRLIIEKRLPFSIKNGLCKGNKLYSIHEDEEGYISLKRYKYELLKD